MVGRRQFVAYMSDKSGRDEIWISDPEGRSPKKITDLDNEKGAIVWTPDSKSCLYRGRQEVYTQRCRCEDGDRDVEHEPDRLGGRRRTAGGWRSRNRIDAALARTSRRLAAEERHLGGSPALFATRSGRPTALPRVHLDRRLQHGIVARGINTTMGRGCAEDQNATQ